MIGDYSVAMNGSGIALILSVCDVDRDGITDAIYTVHIGNGVTTQNKVAFDDRINISPQITSFGSGFIYSYYTDNYIGYSDIVLGKINSDGSVDYSFDQTIGAAAGLYGIAPTYYYRLLTNGNEVAIAWAAYDHEVDGYAIYATLLADNNGKLAFTAPITLVEPTAGTLLAVPDGTLDGIGEVTVLYNSVEYDDFMMSPGTNGFAGGQFANDFMHSAHWDNEDVVAESELPIAFSITNTGVNEITQIVILWGDGGVDIWGGLSIPLCGAYSNVAYKELGADIANLSYDITVTFSNGGVVTQGNNILFIAKPDISIGNTVVTKSELGKREFAVNLYNISDVRLAGSGYSVRLSFYSDPMHNEPVSVSGDLIISDNARLALIDEGGLSLFYIYAFGPGDLMGDGEVPSTGIRLFIGAEIIDGGGKVVPESDYGANSGNVLLSSLLRYGQGSVTALVNTFDSGNSAADISVVNRSMNGVAANSGRIVAFLLDESGGVVETKTQTVTNALQGEDTLDYSFAFSQAGYVVNASYETLSADAADSSLSSLGLSSIPFALDNSAIPANGIIALTAENVYGVDSTILTAIAKNPGAIITVNGVQYSDTAVANMPLLVNTAFIDIIVTVGGSSTAYKLTINTPSSGNSGGGGGNSGGGSYSPAPQTPTPTPAPPVEPEPDVLVDMSDAPPVQNPFTDISPSDWFYDDVMYVYANGLMNGMTATTFEPLTQLTRAMIVTILFRHAGTPDYTLSADPYPLFSDVVEGSWYSDAVLWAQVNGIVQGYGDGLFGPLDYITRQDLAVILMRYAELVGFDLPEVRDYQGFDDGADIAGYAMEAVEALYCAGVINGRDSGVFDPKGNATRAEVAAMLHRFLEMIVDAEPTDI